MKKYFLLLLISCSHTQFVQKKPKNLILVIVDGMGPEQVKAGRIFLGNQALSFEKFPYQSHVTTHNVDGGVTDSAAAATAIATGQKVKNRVISPGKTLLETFKEQGKSTGVATNTLLTDATPAAFAGHAKTRQDTKDILKVYLEQTQPNLIAGADEPFYQEEVQTSNAGYQIVSSKQGLQTLVEQIKTGQKIDHVYAGFGQHALIPGHFERQTGLPLEVTGNAFFQEQNLPHLSDTAEAALELLSQNPKGFFLMIESGLVDWVGHKNHDLENPMEALGAEMAETHKMVQTISHWADEHPETLVIVTADHETGGLQIDERNTNCLGQMGCLAKAAWTADFYPDYVERFSQHTGVNVGVYAKGPGAENFNAPMDNTEFVTKILGQ